MNAKALPVPPADAPEHERARWWRENVVRLSRRALAEAIGLSESRITDMEAGTRVRGSSEPVDAGTMTRYRLACAALTLGVQFDWLSCTLSPSAPVTISIGHWTTGRE